MHDWINDVKSFPAIGNATLRLHMVNGWALPLCDIFGEMSHVAIIMKVRKPMLDRFSHSDSSTFLAFRAHCIFQPFARQIGFGNLQHVINFKIGQKVRKDTSKRRPRHNFNFKGPQSQKGIVVM